MRKLRLGVIGCGVIGTSHLHAAMECETVEVAAVADLIPERRERAAAETGAPAVYASGEELIDGGEAEAVVLAVPAGDRREMPRQALSRGKHVLIEKPAAFSQDALQSYIDVQGGLIAASCSSRYHSLPSTQAATEFVASGALGELRTVHCRCLGPTGANPRPDPPDWRLKKERNAGGILCNWGCYDLDYLLGICGWSLQPRTALARTWTVPPQFEQYVSPGSDAETYFTALILCDGGTAITFERGEYMPARNESAWHIVGTKGALRLGMTPHQGKQICHDEYRPGEGIVTNVIWEDAEERDVIPTGLLEDFSRAVLDGGSPRTDLSRAMVIQRITDAIYASAAAGAAVVIP